MSHPVTTADIAVVGGGIIGLATAERLTAAGLTVVVVDELGIAGGATGASGGLVRAFAPSDDDQGFAAAGLTVYRKRGWRGLWPAVRGGGGLTFLAPGDRAGASSRVASLRAAGHEAELLTADAITARFPGLRTAPGEFAVHEPEAGWLPVREVAAAMVRDAGPLLRVVQARATRLLTSGTRVVGVRTDTGTVEARAVLLAAGTGSTPLAAGVGITLPLRTRAVGYCLFRLDGPAPALPAVVDRATGAWLRPWNTASVVLAGVHSPLVDVPATVVHGVPDHEVERVRRVLLPRLPQLAGAPAVGGVTAHDAMSPGGAASVDVWPGADGLVTATGWNGGGFKLAPAVGERAAGMLRKVMA
ncbi:NAD(P)/FAD-dependent oxidoreductase [Streptomyces sp. NPDC058008]|uniref:NAD(P)/FAD-dependent oxidoreductase n=1 Tax=Streptomyces sp. NPDC058008 TaxID=3346303 RepID=UPI0036E6F252